MPAQNPTQLVDEFKKSGEFDRLRRDLLTQFRNGEGMAALTARVQEIVQEKLSSDLKLQYMAEGSVVRELMQELERYPLIERAIADLPCLSDTSLATNIRQHVTSLPQDIGQEGTKTERTPTSERLVGTSTGAQATLYTVQATDIARGDPHLIHVRTEVSPTAPGRSEPLEEDKGPARSVHFIDSSVPNHSASSVGRDSPGSAMLESPLTEADDHASEPDIMVL